MSKIIIRQLLACCVLIFYSAVCLSQVEQTPTPQWRPLYHFTPLQNWTNDPNGLIYIDGVYHLYNQQNPFENKWGHMSWGHATSTDLVHWKHLPIAIPETIDKDTTWIFSGCAVWDKDNSSGFCKTGGCLVAIYTADQPNLKKESQFVAYSNDGGMTFTDFAHNPVIDLQKRDFRDPNVSWNVELQKWVMVVALPNDHKVRFYSSGDLKEWELLSEFGNAGYTGAPWECPSLMQLPVEGTGNNKKWVLTVSAGGPEKGPFMQYFLGDFHAGIFKNDNPPDLLLPFDYGDCFYAAIPWNNPPGDKKLFIGWMAPGQAETYPWKGQMSIPRDLSLKETDQGIRLLQEPSSAIRADLDKISSKHVIDVKDLKINDGEIPIEKEDAVRGNSWWMDTELDIDPGATRAGIRIAQKKESIGKEGSGVEIGVNGATHQLYLDRSHCGRGWIKEADQRRTVNLPAGSSRIRLQILFDRSSLEIFVNGGEKVLTTYIFPDTGADALSLFSIGGRTLIRSMRIWDLSGIKND